MTTLSTTICPFCGYEHEFATKIGGVADSRPKTGDATMCIGCGEFSILGKDDMLRKPTRAEAAELAADERVIKMHAAWKAIRVRQ